jgi:hypothetical protein
VRRADQGEFDEAAAALREAATALAACAEAPGVAEEIDDLRAESTRLEQRRYDASDRKYQGARAMAAREMKADYVQRVSRRQPRRS